MKFSRTISPWFPQAKLGIFLHWGIYSVRPTGESWPFFLGEVSHQDYFSQLEGFTAERYDPVLWASLFSAAGARYVVLTAKHHDGVALWDTAHSPLNVAKATPAGRDLVGPFCQAMRNAGLKVGLYFSHIDWSHPDYPTAPRDKTHSQHPHAQLDNQYNFQRDDPTAWRRFLDFHRAQILELCERFNPDLLWFDGDWDHTAEQWQVDHLIEDIRRKCPHIVLNSRLKGRGDYHTPEQGLPTTPPEGPWEFCMTCNDHWGYYASDKNYKSPHQILWYFSQCLSRGGNLLLNFSPRKDGTLPDEQISILCELARWNTRHQRAVFPTTSGLPPGHFEGPTTLSTDRSRIYLFLTQPPTMKIPLLGVMNQVSNVRVVGAESLLRWQVFGGSAWHDVPGVLWIDPPPQADCDPTLTVLEVELMGPLKLYRGDGGPIHND